MTVACYPPSKAKKQWCRPLLFMKRVGAFLRLILIPLFWISANVNLSKAKTGVDLLLLGYVKESKDKLGIYVIA